MSTRHSSDVRPTGLTRDADWEIGVSRTVSAPLNAVWSLLTSERGVALWLGGGAALPRVAGSAYRTADGTTGEVRSYHEGDRVRLTWRPRDWDHDATLQIAVSGDEVKTTIRFHQERLASAEERERMRDHWRSMLDALIAELTPAG